MVSVIHSLVSFFLMLYTGQPIDDRQLLLEHGVSMLQTLPSNSGLGHSLSDAFIGVSGSSALYQ